MHRQRALPALAWLTILCLVTCEANADPLAYALTATGSPITDTRLATIDLTTGVYTPIGNTGNSLLHGLGSVGAQVYSAAFLGNTLYQINASNGSLTTVGVGTFLVGYNGFGSTKTGLFGVDTLTQNLLSVNPSTGADTVVGPTGLVPGAVSGMSTGSSQLFLTELTGAGDVLYQLDTGAGAATMIGNTGIFGIAAMVWTNGKLYAVNSHFNSSVSLWTLDTSTGAATLIANTSGAGNFIDLGLAPIIPEPSSLVLVGSGLLAALGAARCRRLKR